MAELIEVKNLSKHFITKQADICALQDINLTISQGDIFGIIGMSGAGKSTFVRCLNFLERPTEGTVLIDGKDLSKLSEKELRQVRGEIAMIFQHFNLLMQKTVLDNICFPLTIKGVRKKAARQKAEELLKVVGLEDKANAYPAELSGGQKQRVAIARALAADPKILLCDEATSALDPQTTESILKLLKDINAQFGITIVIITHEMDVVREICSHVGIIGNGELVEEGTVVDIFSHPKTRQARELIGNKNGRSGDSEKREVDILNTGRCIRIVFRENSAFEPVVSNMVLKFGQPVNILKADTKNVSGIAHGEMILGLPDDELVRRNMIEYLTEKGLAVEEADEYVG